MEPCRFIALKEEMIRDPLVVGLADVDLSERLQMDPNLTLQRAIKSAKNWELVKRQQGTIKSTVKSYEIKAVRREISRLFKYKGCPWCRGYRTHKRSRCPANYSRLFTVNVADYIISKNLAVLQQFEEAPNIFNIATSNNLLQKICNELLSDHVCSRVINFCQNVWPSKARVGHHLQSYFQVGNNILFQKGILLKCDRLVIPMILQKKILNTICEGHEGTTKCRAKLEVLGSRV